MKRKLMLFVLPLFMVLSGCHAAPKQEANIMIEDTFAHEEIFGEAVEGGDLKLESPHKALDPAVKPSLGVQYRTYNEGGNDYFSVRYFALIDDLGITAKWNRGVSRKDSNQGLNLIANEENFKPSTKAYRVLNSNGTPLNAPSGSYYIVYTLDRIPAEYQHGYIAAYLTLDDGINRVVSDVCAAEIDVVDEPATPHHFTFPVDKSGYFLQGTINGVANTIIDESGTQEGDDKARFDNVVFGDDDDFGMFKFNSSTFQFFGYETFMNGHAYLASGDTNGYGKVTEDGQYSFFINDWNGIYPSVTTTLYLDCGYDLGEGGKWGNGARFAVWAWKDGGKSQWYSMAHDSGDLYKVEGFNLTDYDKVIFCRMDSSNPTNGWDKDYPLYNKTGDLNIQTQDGTYLIAHNKYTVKAWDNAGDGTDGANWTAYSA